MSRIFFCSLVFFASQAVASPVTLTEQNYRLAWSQMESIPGLQVTASCAPSNRANCPFTSEESQLFHSLLTVLPAELKSPLQFTSRRLHPELFSDAPGWPADFSTALIPSDLIRIDTDFASTEPALAGKMLLLAMFRHLQITNPNQVAQVAELLAQSLFTGLTELPELSLKQSRVRLTTQASPFFQFNLFDDAKVISVRESFLHSLVCDAGDSAGNPQAGNVQISDLTWQPPLTWNKERRTQPLQIDGKVAFCCANACFSRQFTGVFEFTPTFNDFPINRPDWQSVRGVLLRINPSVQPQFSLPHSATKI